MQKRGRRDRMYALALAGVGSALSLGLIAMSMYLPVARLTFAVLSGIGVMLPFAKDYVREGVLSYIASSLLSLLYGPIMALRFIVLFGLYPVLYYFAQFKLKNKFKSVVLFYAVSWAVKLIYFNLTAWALTVAMGIDLNAVELFGKTPTLPLLVLIANLAFVLYDVMLYNIFKLIKYYAAKVIR